MMEQLPTIEQMVGNVEQQFKQKIHEEVMERLKKFTFKENMMIAFTPVIITELIWMYAELVTDYAAQERLSETKKLSRMVKEMRKKYNSELRIDLTQDQIERIERISTDFVEKCQRDLTLLWFTVNNELKRDFYEIGHLDMRTNAYIAIVLCDVLQEHNDAMDELIKEKMGSVSKVKNRLIEALRSCMEAYLSPATLDRSIHVKTSMRIIHNNLNLIDFDIQ